MGFRSLMFISREYDKLRDLQKELRIIAGCSAEVPIEIFEVNKLEQLTDVHAFMINTVDGRFDQLVESLKMRKKTARLDWVYTLAYSDDKQLILLYMDHNYGQGEVIRSGKDMEMRSAWNVHGLTITYISDYFHRKALDLRADVAV